MILRSGLAVIISVLALLLAPSPGSAQVSLGIGGGPSIPTGRLADVVGTGVHGGVIVEFGLPLLPFSVRGDATFQHMPGANGGEDYQQVSGTLNGKLDLLPIPLLSAYLIGGIGMYGSGFAREPEVTGWTAQTGINAGVGAQINLFVLRPFIEARFHRVLSDPARSYVPITVGAYF